MKYLAIAIAIVAAFFYGRYHQNRIDDKEYTAALINQAEVIAHYESKKSEAMEAADFYHEAHNRIEKDKQTTTDSFARVIKKERSQPVKIVTVTSVYTLECDSAKAVGLQLAGQVEALESESSNLRDAIGICDLSNNFLQTVIVAKERESAAKSDSIQKLQSDLNKQAKRKRIWRGVAVSCGAVITGLILVL